MRSAAPPKTFRQRLKALKIIQVTDEDIPDHFFDHYVSFDIMQNPIAVYGDGDHPFVMDHSSMARFNLQRLQQWDAKTRGGTLYYNAKEDSGFATIGSGLAAMYKWEHKTDLYNEIDAWVTRKETEDLIAQIEEDNRIRKEEEERKRLAAEEAERKREEEEGRRFLDNLMAQIRQRKEQRVIMLRTIENDLELANRKLFVLLSPENPLPEETKEQQRLALLEQIDSLNKSKRKLLLGEKYYELPDVLQYKIQKLLTKQERAATVPDELKEQYFSAADQQKLDLCYKNLDKHPGIKYYRPGLFQLLPYTAPSANLGVPLIALPGLRRNNDED